MRGRRADGFGYLFPAARWSNELMLFMKEKEVNPLKSMLVPMAQVSVKSYTVIWWKAEEESLTRGVVVALSAVMF